MRPSASRGCGCTQVIRQQLIGQCHKQGSGLFKRNHRPENKLIDKLEVISLEALRFIIQGFEYLAHLT